MENKYAVPAVEKMLNIIELLAQDEQGHSINELARRTNASVNSVYRICMELESRKYLVKDPVSGYYVLGSSFCYIGKAAARRMTLCTSALPVMEKLMELTGETVHLTVLHGDRMVLLEQLETGNNIRVHVETGIILELHGSAFGKCLLAYAGEAMINQYLANGPTKLTRNTITEPSALKKELQAIRQSGIAYDNEEYLDGLLCVGAPIFGSCGDCIASVGVILPKYRSDDNKIAAFADAVRAAAAELSSMMGFTTIEISPLNAASIVKGEAQNG